MVELTESHRQTLLLVITILALGCFFSSFMLFVSAAYIKVKVDARMKLIETYNSDVLPAIFVFVGVVNIVQNIMFMFVCLKLRTIENRENLMRLLLPILIGGGVLVVFEVASAIASFVHMSILDEEFRIGLNKAMNEYIQGGELKVEMDTVQIEYGCCGDRDYTNWFAYSWIDPQYLRVSKGAAKKYFSTDGKYYSDDTPYSCCDMRSPRPCIHHHIHENSRHHNYDYKQETTLHVQGCREVLMSIYNSVLATVAWIALLTAAAKTTALMLFRLVHTSLIAADELNNWEATTPAYIYYLKLPDADVQEKTEEDKQNTNNQRSKRGRQSSETDTDTGTGTADTTRTESESETDSNKNYDDTSDDSENEIKPKSDDKSAWRPLSFPAPPIKDPSYVPENVRSRNVDGGDFNIQSSAVAQQYCYYNAEFRADNGERLAEDYYKISENTCPVQRGDGQRGDGQRGDGERGGGQRGDGHRGDGERGGGQRGDAANREVEDADKDTAEQDPSFCNVSSSCGDLGGGGTGGVAQSTLAWLKKTMLGNKEFDDRVKVNHQYSRCPQDERETTSRKREGSSREKTRPMKFRTSSDNYKYALVGTSSNSEDEEEEEEEDMGNGSGYESDLYSNVNSRGDTRGKPYSSQLVNKRDTVPQSNKVIAPNHDHTERSNNATQIDVVKNKITRNNKLDSARLISLRLEQQQTDGIQSSDDPAASDEPSPFSSKRSAQTNDHTESCSESDAALYHEENEKMKHNSQVISDNWAKTEKFSDTNSVSFSNTVFKHRAVRQYQDTTSSDITSSFEQASCQYEHTTSIKPNCREVISNHRQVVEFRLKLDSSETESDVTVLNSADGNSHPGRFLGRSTPYPFQIERHETKYYEEYDLLPTNVRRNKNLTAPKTESQPLVRKADKIGEPARVRLDKVQLEKVRLDKVQLEKVRLDKVQLEKVRLDKVQLEKVRLDKVQLEKVRLDKVQLEKVRLDKVQLEKVRLDIRESDTEVSQLTNFAENREQPGAYVAGNSKQDHKVTQQTLNEPDNNKVSDTTTTSSSSRGIRGHSATSFPSRDISNLSPDNELEGANVETPLFMKSAENSFFFPLMMPSPSSLELSGHMRNHIRSYQRRSIFLSSPISSTVSPIHPSSPHLALFSSPFMDTHMETSTPIYCTNRTDNSRRCQAVSTPILPSDVIRLANQMDDGDCTRRPLLAIDKDNVSCLSNNIAESLQTPTVSKTNDEPQDKFSNAGARPANLERTRVKCGEPQANLERTRVKCGEPQANLERTRVKCGEPQANLERTRVKCGEPQAPLQQTSSNDGTRLVLATNNNASRQVPALVTNNVGSRQVPAVVTNNVGSRQVPALVTNNVGSRQVTALATNNVGSRQVTVLATNNVGSRQVTALATNNVGSRQVTALATNNVGSQNTTFIASSHPGPKQAPVIAPSHAGAKQAPVIAPSHAGAKQGPVIAPSHPGPKQGPVIAPSHRGAKQGPVIAPSHAGPKQGPMIASSHAGAKQGPMIASSHAGPKQGPMIASSHAGPKQGPVIASSHTGPKQGPVIASSHDGPNQAPLSRNIETGQSSVLDIFGTAQVPFPRRADADTTKIPFPRRADADTTQIPLPRRADADTTQIPFPRRADADTTKIPFPRRADADTAQVPFPRRFDADTNQVPFPRRFDADTNQVPFPRRADADTAQVPFPRRFDADTNQVPFPRRFDADTNQVHFPRRFDADAAQVPFPRRFDADTNQTPLTHTPGSHPGEAGKCLQPSVTVNQTTPQRTATDSNQPKPSQLPEDKKVGSGIPGTESSSQTRSRVLISPFN